MPNSVDTPYQVSFAEPEPITIKSPATITEQIEKLKLRGLIIENEVKARRILETVNYYRLVHYFAVFLDETGKHYKSGTRFEHGIRIYEFDKRLRSEILVALEELEISARAAISNYHATKYGATGYLNADSFDRRHNHKAFVNKIERMKDTNSRLVFVRHHNRKYGGAFPLWVMMEMFSFGMLTMFFSDMKLNDKKDISEHYFHQDYRNIENWLTNLSNLRNHCAHYNRVYGNPMPEALRGVGGGEMGASLYDYLYAVTLLLSRGDPEWDEELGDSLKELFADYSDVVDPRVLGFPKISRSF